MQGCIPCRRYRMLLERTPYYHRKTPLVVSEVMRREIDGAVAEIDLAQMEILQRMTPALSGRRS